jgi:hypothetical protein
MTFAGWQCRHDLVAWLADFDLIRKALESPQTGVADTGMAHGWRRVRGVFPDARFAVLRRPRHEIEASLARQGVDPAWVDLTTIERCLDEIAALPGTLVMDCQDLSRENPARRLWEFCVTGVPWARWWWDLMRHTNIQIDMRARLLLMQENRDKIAWLKERARDHVSA